MEPRLLDEVAAAATAAQIDHHVDGWWCKASPDLPFRRASAVLPAAGAGTDRAADAQDLTAIGAWYDRIPLPVLVQVSDALPAHVALDRDLAARGWAMEAPVHILVRALGSDLGGNATPSPARVITCAGVDVAWAQTNGVLHGADEVQRRRVEGYGRMLAPVGPRAIGATASVGAQVAGVGFAILDESRPVAGIYGMATSPVHRRQGIASALLVALLEAARSAGAREAYLQVEADNHAALALYDVSGFTLSHRYHYRRRGA